MPNLKFEGSIQEDTKIINIAELDEAGRGRDITFIKDDTRMKETRQAQVVATHNNFVIAI